MNVLYDSITFLKSFLYSFECVLYGISCGSYQDNEHFSNSWIVLSFTDAFTDFQKYSHEYFFHSLNERFLTNFTIVIDRWISLNEILIYIVLHNALNGIKLDRVHLGLFNMLWIMIKWYYVQKDPGVHDLEIRIHRGKWRSVLWIYVYQKENVTKCHDIFNEFREIFNESNLLFIE